MTVFRLQIYPFLTVYYLQALCENLRVDFSRDSINAVMGHSLSCLKETSQIRFLISYRNFSQPAEAAGREPDARGQQRFI